METMKKLLDIANGNSEKLLDIANGNSKKIIRHS